MNEYVPLGQEETLKLIELSQSGNENAKEKLIVHNIALVKSIVKKYVGKGIEYDDLYQLGCMGLVKAISNFDVSFNVRFSTYAVPMIAGEIKRFMRDDGMIKVSRSLKELAIKAMSSQEKFLAQNGHEATISEIAKDIDADVEDVMMALESAMPHMSIYEPVYESDSEIAIVDKIADDSMSESGMVDRIMLKELLATLEAKERQIIVMRYFQDKTQTEVAKAMGVSQVQISRLENKILEKMRKRVM